ncbi:MAG: hypothetical protein JNJ86_07980 [Chitinophagaceae bacterium]|nr:hypothetical protein [Chitinophagaceae bacterium]
MIATFNTNQGILKQQKVLTFSKNVDNMKLILASLLFFVYNASAQHPYRDSIQGIFKIDERLIARRTDTIVSLSKSLNEKDTFITKRIVICRDGNNKIVRIDKIFQDNNKFAFAYFINQEFHLMQWNEPQERDLYESASIVKFFQNPGIRTFYSALLTLPGITMPKLTTYTH